MQLTLAKLFSEPSDFLLLVGLCPFIFLWVARLPSINTAAATGDWKIPQLSWLDLLLPLALCFLGIFLVQTVLVTLNKGLQLETLEYQIVGTYTLQGTLIGMLLYLRINFPNQYGPPLNKEKAQTACRAILHALITFLKFLPLIWLAAALSQMFFQLLGFQLEQQKPVEILLNALEQEPAKFWALAFGAIVLAPIAEELLFRSYIYRFLKSKYTTHIATLVSAFLFAAMHANLASLVPLFVLGVLFARTYENTGNIVAPMMYHALFNASSIVLMFLAPYFTDM